MAKSNSKSDSAKSQTAKLSPAQKHLLDLCNSKYGYSILQGEKELRTAMSLSKRNLVLIHESFHWGVYKNQYDVTLTEDGRKALGADAYDPRLDVDAIAPASSEPITPAGLGALGADWPVDPNWLDKQPAPEPNVAAMTPKSAWSAYEPSADEVETEREVKIRLLKSMIQHGNIRYATLIREANSIVEELDKLTIELAALESGGVK